MFPIYNLNTLNEVNIVHIRVLQSVCYDSLYTYFDDIYLKMYMKLKKSPFSLVRHARTGVQNRPRLRCHTIEACSRLRISPQHSIQPCHLLANNASPDTGTRTGNTFKTVPLKIRLAPNPGVTYNWLRKSVVRQRLPLPKCFGSRLVT